MASTGTNGVGTSGSGWTTILTLTTAPRQLAIFNNGSVDGFFRLVAADGVTVTVGPCYLPAGGAREFNMALGANGQNNLLQIQRVGNSDMTLVYADAL